MTRTVRTATPIIAALLVAGCSPAATPTPAEVNPTPSATTPAAGLMTVTGTVVDGVEAGCRILQTDTGGYVLTGPAAAGLSVGSTVTVRGRIQVGALSICNQGAVFHAVEVVSG